jgi:hypothetical protein
MSRPPIVIACVLCLVSICAHTTHAQQLSLWADEGMKACEVTGQAPYTPFTVYVFLEPGFNGAFAVEYKLVVLSGHFATATNPAPFVGGATIGTWVGPPGISAPFNNCQEETVWIVALTMMAPNATAGRYTLKRNDTSDFIGVATCPGSRPLADAVAATAFGYNMACEPTAEESSWGAVKSQYE